MVSKISEAIMSKLESISIGDNADKVQTGGSIKVNGETYKGNNVKVINDKVYIDGKLVENSYDKQIVVKGDVNKLITDRSVRCNDVGEISKANGSVKCDNVEGEVKAGGSVSCEDIGSSVNCGGSVTANNIEGNVSAGGSISY